MGMNECVYVRMSMYVYEDHVLQVPIQNVRNPQ